MGRSSERVDSSFIAIAKWRKRIFIDTIPIPKTNGKND